MEKRYCKQCGKELIRKLSAFVRKNGKECKQFESLGLFTKRQFCDRKCFSVSTRKLDSVSRSKTIIHGYHRTKIDIMVLKRDNYRCLSCGFNGELVIYTKGNTKTNPELHKDVSAKQTLCKTCLMYQKVMPYAAAQYLKILELAPKYNLAYIAKQLGISYQRVHQQLKKAEARGQINMRGIVLQRKRAAIKIADQSHPTKSLL